MNKTNKTLEQFAKTKISSALQFDAVVEQLQQTYALINRNGKAFIVHEDDKLGMVYSDIDSFHALNQRYSYTQEMIIKGRVQEVTRYATREFMKSTETRLLKGIIFDPRLDNSRDVPYLNLWKGWNYEAIKGDVSLFLELVNVNAGFNDLVYEYMLNFFAHSIQKPGQIPRTALVIKGPQGSGKGTLFVDTISKLNDNSKHLTSIDMLTGQFNGHLSDAYVVVADEISFGGNIAEANKLKTLISESSRTVNDKMKTAFSVDCYSRVIILSNNNFIVNVEEGDRRYVIAEASAKYKGNFDWFGKYQKWLKEGGFESIMYFLKNRDISQFDPFQIPNTVEKSELKLRSQEKHIQFIHEYLNGDIYLKPETHKDEKIYRNDFFNEYIEWMKNNNPQGYRCTARDFSNTMSKAFEFELDNKDWRRNWKNSGKYFYDFTYKRGMLERFAKNMLNAEAKDVFVTYNDLPTK